MNFSFQTCPNIVFEPGAFKRLPQLIGHMGESFLFVNNIPGFFDSAPFCRVKDGFAAMGKEVRTAPTVTGEPTVKGVDGTAELARRLGCGVCVGLGGGSAMDTAKAAAAVAVNGGSVRDYLEGVGSAKVTKRPLPFVALPMTSGTGSEATKNAVVISPEDGVKASIRSDMMLADMVIVDPELVVSAPKSVTASSGMDAICQLIESYTTKNPNPLADALCLYCLPRAFDAMKRAYDCPDDMGARTDMALAALCSGMTLANAGLGLAHGVAAGLGASFGMAHGIACAIMLPYAVRFNHERGVKRVAELGRLICGPGLSDDDAANALCARIEELNAHMGIPADLKRLGLGEEDVEKLIASSLGSSMRKNPVEVTVEDLRSLFARIV